MSSPSWLGEGKLQGPLLGWGGEIFLPQLQARQGAGGFVAPSGVSSQPSGENNVLTAAIVLARLPCRLHRPAHKGSVPPQLWDKLFPTAPQKQLLLTPRSWSGEVWMGLLADGRGLWVTKSKLKAVVGQAAS